MDQSTEELMEIETINKVAEIFKLPQELGISETLFQDAKNLYQLALGESPDDPVGWIRMYNEMQPINFSYGDATNRAGSLLQLGLTTKAMRKKQQELANQEFDRTKII